MAGGHPFQECLGIPFLLFCPIDIYFEKVAPEFESFS